jgi:hypothetical protein
VDPTKNGNAVPAVDDLATIPLALWAEEYGYQRIHGNLLGPDKTTAVAMFFDFFGCPITKNVVLEGAVAAYYRFLGG